MLEAFSDCIEAARHHVHISAGATVLEDLRAAITAASKRGVTCHLLSRDEISEIGSLSVLHESSTPEEPELCCVVADLENAVLASTQSDMNGLRTESRCLVFISQKYLLHRIYLAKLAEHTETLPLVPANCT